MRMWKLTPIASVLSCSMAVHFSGEVNARQPGYQARTERGTAAGKIVRRWAGYVQQVYGTPPMRWARSMERTFAQTDLHNLQHAVHMQTYEGMMGTMLGQRSSDARVIDRMAASKSTTVDALAVGSPAEDLVYTMVSPCRILDTRNANGRIASGEARAVFVHGSSFASQGGVNENCAIPADPSAVVINVVAVSPDADGFLSAYPYGGARAASSLNYTRNAIVANELIAKTTVGQPYDLTVFSQSGTDVVIDIVGYFMAPKASEPDCHVVERYASLMSYSGKTLVASCPTGYLATGGACYWSSPSPLYKITGTRLSMRYESYPRPSPLSYVCDGHNDSGGSAGFYAQAVCCRNPGR